MLIRTAYRPQAPQAEPAVPEVPIRAGDRVDYLRGFLRHVSPQMLYQLRDDAARRVAALRTSVSPPAPAKAQPEPIASPWPRVLLGG
jgi:hypothetical protein